MKNGRSLLKLGLLAVSITLVLAIAFALNGVGTAGAGDAATAPELEGTWLATITAGEQTFQSLLTYGRGGALIITDGGVAPASGNVYQGTWTKTGAHEYTFTFLGLQYEGGVFSGYLRGHETLRLKSGGQSYEGDGTVEVLDTEGNVLFAGDSTSTATRVNP